jgi:hypothetical protein
MRVFITPLVMDSDPKQVSIEFVIRPRLVGLLDASLWS